MKIIVEINNLDTAQAMALEDMFATWVSLGNIGSSRWTSFFCDGDGNFRPKINVNGEKAKFAPSHIITDDMRNQMWKNDQYKIDFDMIAWILRDKSLIRDNKIQNLNKENDSDRKEPA